jgi:hypothetical protein
MIGRPSRRVAVRAIPASGLGEGGHGIVVADELVEPDAGYKIGGVILVGEGALILKKVAAREEEESQSQKKGEPAKPSFHIVV